MDPRFDELYSRPENQIFRVVFFPDRIYHASYLNATRSARYRYAVHEVRAKADINVLKGDVFIDGQRFSSFVRIEYRASRLVEVSREKGRLSQEQAIAWVKLVHADPTRTADSMVRLHRCRWTETWMVEIWQTLEPPDGIDHDFQILDMMGADAPITRVPAMVPALEELRDLKKVEIAFREAERDERTGVAFTDPQWDNNYLSSHQEPRDSSPSSQANTVSDKNYLLDFQRGWLLNAADVQPVRYRNAMMDSGNPDARDENVIEMRWLVQRELGGPVVFFHEVTIPPKTVEGTHHHVGSEELYYVVEGEGTAYMGKDDDPGLANAPIVDRHIYGIGVRECREVRVRKGSVLFTKSGGIHGIRNDGDVPLKFVAFLYQSS